MFKIVCVTARALCPGDFLAQLERVAAAGVDKIILREKDLPEPEYKLLAAQALAPLLTAVGIPPETVGLMLVRPVSGSAALGVGAELIATYGPDSEIGRTAAVMLGSTETTFYTIAVYFGAAGIVKTRYAVPAALCADLAGFLAAAWAVRLIF